MCVFSGSCDLQDLSQNMVDSDCVQKLMASQGIRGPPYRLLAGNAKEISNMGKDVMSRSLDLSHNILPVVLPHVHAWTKIYGMYLQILETTIVLKYGNIIRLWCCN